MVEVVLEAVYLEVFAKPCLVLDGDDFVVVVEDAVVEDGLDNQVFACLGVEELGIVVGEDVLHR